MRIVRGRGHGRGLRNGALPPRSSYETLRNGALGSGDTFFNARSTMTVPPYSIRIQNR